MRYLLLSSCLLLLACVSSKVQQLKKPGEFHPVNFNWDSTTVYKTNISVIGQNYSGLIIFNKENDSTFRVVMTTDIGPKLMDLFVTPHGYTKNYTIRQMNRKAILRMFWEDFGTALGLFSRNSSTLINDSTSCYHLAGKFSVCYESKDAQTAPSIAYFLEDDKKKTKISYFYKAEAQPDSIVIEHLSFNMSYFLHNLN